MTAPFYADDTITLHHGDCIDVMRTLPADSVDSIVTDPPYGLGFMGKKWDALPPGEEWARECLRVLKPGGHLLAFGGTRTWHRLAVAVEDAGFELRDSIAWMYSQGFPKSMDVAKAITATQRYGGGSMRQIRKARMGEGYEPTGQDQPMGVTYDAKKLGRGDDGIATELTADAEVWSGWGTALKPAFEPIVMGRKPLIGTVAANVMAHGTGGLNIGENRGVGERWPANVILDEHMAAELDGSAYGDFKGQADIIPARGVDSGGASRFFYVAKAPAKERPVVDGVGHETVKPLALMRWLVRLVTPAGGTVLETFAGSGTTVEACILEGLKCIAIEREATYLPLIQVRIDRNAATLDLGAWA